MASPYNTTATFLLSAFPSGSYNGISTAVIQQQLDVAASEINAALRPFHTLPMATGSSDSDLQVIYNAEVTIVSYRLMSYRGFKPDVNGTQDEHLHQRYLEIVGEGGLLDKLSRGKILLARAADATPTVREKRSKMYGTPNGRSQTIVDSNGNEYI